MIIEESDYDSGLIEKQSMMMDEDSSQADVKQNMRSENLIHSPKFENKAKFSDFFMHSGK